VYSFLEMFLVNKIKNIQRTLQDVLHSKGNIKTFYPGDGKLHHAQKVWKLKYSIDILINFA
jgi:hypothetical protein